MARVFAVPLEDGGSAVSPPDSLSAEGGPERAEQILLGFRQTSEAPLLPRLPVECGPLEAVEV